MSFESRPYCLTEMNSSASPFKEHDLSNLAKEMHNLDLGAFSEIPSGYVYFGQFLMHDISRLMVSDVKSQNGFSSVTKVKNLNSPGFNLETIYGHGFYDSTVAVDHRTGKLALAGIKADTEMGKANGKIMGYDLPRMSGSGKAMIGDSRNDGNLLLAQLHVQFIKLHNYFIDMIGKENVNYSPIGLYEKARLELIVHYQQVILYDWLKRLLNKNVWTAIIVEKKSILWHPEYFKKGILPVEFSGAVARFGHAMVRREYIINNFQAVSLEDIVGMTGPGNFMGKGALPFTHVVDWRYFFNFGDDVRYPKNTAQKISPEVHLSIPGIAAIPALSLNNNVHMVSMASRIFLRGSQLKVPDAQSIIANILKTNPEFAKEVGLKILVEELKILGNRHGEDILARASGDDQLKKTTPLWFYILAEAYNASGKKRGDRLGPLGSLIMAEVIRNLINISVPSVLKYKNWRSSYIKYNTQYLQMSDLLNVVNND